MATAAGAESVAVPVQAFEIQELLRHAAVASLVHPQHTVDAFHQAAGSIGTAKNVLDRRQRLRTFVAGFAQHDGAQQQHTAQRGRLGILSLQYFGAATQGFLTHRRLFHFFSKRQSGDLHKDGKLSNHCEMEGEILVWDLATGRQLPSLKQSPPHCVNGVMVLPDCATLLALDCVGDDNVRRFRKHGLTRWNTRTGEHDHLLDGFWNVWFAPDGKTFAASLVDVQATSPTSVRSRGKLILCGTSSGKERLVFAQTDNGRVSAANFSPDGRYLAGFRDDDLRATKPLPSEVKLWDLATGKEVGAIVAPQGATPFRRRGGGIYGPYAEAVFSLDGRWLATCLHTGRIYLYDVSGRKLAWSQEVKNGYLRMVRFSPDGRWLAVLGQDIPEDLKPREEVSPFDLPQPRIFLFDMKTGGQPEEIVAPHGQIVGFDFSPDNKTIALSGTGCV